MKVVAIVSLLIVAFCCSSFAEEAAAESDVIVLTDATIDRVKEGIWMVEFYAPWCGHCKRLAPTWDQFATTFKGKFNVAKVDCTVEKDSAKAYEIKGFPTLKLFKNGEVVPYSGARTVESFAKFVEDNAGISGLVASLPEAPKAAEPVKEEKKEEKPKEEEKKGDAASDVVVLTADNFEATTKDGNWLIEFYAPWCGHCKKLAPTWEELATTAKGKFGVAKVDCTVEKDLAQKYGIRGYPTIKLFTNGEVKDYKGQRAVNDFVSFVESSTKTAKDEL
jgi:protein disulfide-isomerase-like protein